MSASLSLVSLLSLFCLVAPRARSDPLGEGRQLLRVSPQGVLVSTSSKPLLADAATAAVEFLRRPSDGSGRSDGEVTPPLNMTAFLIIADDPINQILQGTRACSSSVESVCGHQN